MMSSLLFWLFYSFLIFISFQEENNFLKSNRKRRKHTKLERLRRCEQRALFEKLKTVLNSHPKTPKYHLLSLVSSLSDGLSFIQSRESLWKVVFSWSLLMRFISKFHCCADDGLIFSTVRKLLRHKISETWWFCLSFDDNKMEVAV